MRHISKKYMFISAYIQSTVHTYIYIYLLAPYPFKFWGENRIARKTQDGV